MNSPACRIVSVSLLALLVFTLASAQETWLFDTRSEYIAGSQPSTIATVDLNDDGILDVAAGCNESGIFDIVVFLGNGDGTFQEMVVYDTEGHPNSIAIEDLNGDGCPDIVATTEPNAHLCVLIGNGDGTFQAPVEYWIPYGPTAVTIGDFDEDGNPDLAIAGHNNPFILVSLGRGDGTFSMPTQYASESWLEDIAVGDLDGDGHLDLATADSGSESVSVFLGNGDGTFEAAVNYETDQNRRPLSIVISDLDGDGWLDLVSRYVSSASNGVLVFLSNGDGTFQEEIICSVLPSAYDVAVGDMDNDGIPDLVVVTRFGVSVLLGAGDGMFGEPVGYDGGRSPRSVSIGDLDSDGNLDLIVANSNISINVGVISAVLGNGDGTLKSGLSFASGGYAPQFIAGDDLDGDGNMDLAVTNSSIQKNVMIFLGHGDGTFQSGVEYEMAGGQIAINDLNGDSYPDLAVVNGDGDSVSICLGNGDGTFQPAVDFPTDHHDPWAIAIDDFNLDGNMDLAVTNTYYLDNTVSVMLGNGDGTFQTAAHYDVGIGSWFASIASGDLDGDGSPEIIVTRFLVSEDNLAVLIGNGDGTFQAPVYHAVGSKPSSVAVDDLDGDGALDLVTSSSDRQNLSVLLGNGDGSLGEAANYWCDGRPWFVTVGDLNGDAFPDLVAASVTGDFISVHLGRGDGTFLTKNKYLVGIGPYSIAMEDLDNNGLPDLAVANKVSDSISIMINRGANPDTVSAELTCTPGSGTLPFSSLFQAAMTNKYSGLTRRIQYAIDVTLAGGQYYSNWRRGWQNVQAGDTYTGQWSQTVPHLPSVTGVNVFQMTVADVTPPPYNQPPYPPAGDTDRDNCTVTGVAP